MIVEGVLWVIFSATLLKTLLVTDAVWNATGRRGLVSTGAAWAKGNGRTVQEGHAIPISGSFNNNNRGLPLAQVGRGSGMSRRKPMPRHVR